MFEVSEAMVAVTVVVGVVFVVVAIVRGDWR